MAFDEGGALVGASDSGRVARTGSAERAEALYRVLTGGDVRLMRV
ncbi:hypothetical protein ACWD33_14545 [Streptomyces xiamenensis]|uniref:Uncharacterized protein n=1 Tax=Streptomyces xiamenensis TaxID=408015 RepID=A0A0F7FZX3_9ACTN|nr:MULTISPECIES: hypothetical protein [Streptomyces]AKG45840.1 hypothetical protein SXIM_44560 [Streptomyces xiamenensis]